jgi:hypothetical protein
MGRKSNPGTCWKQAECSRIDGISARLIGWITLDEIWPAEGRCLRATGLHWLDGCDPSAEQGQRPGDCTPDRRQD